MDGSHSVLPPQNFGRETEFLKNCLWGGGPDLSICLGGGLFGQELKFNEIPVGGEPKIVDKIIFLWLETRAIEYFLEINGIVLKQQDHIDKWNCLETRPHDKWNHPITAVLFQNGPLMMES